MKDANYSPVYAALYPVLTEIARSMGYAMAIHGSMARDFDVVCIPWIANPNHPLDIIYKITTRFDIKVIDLEPTVKHHGRLIWTISIGHGECAIDLSFMPVTKIENYLPRQYPDPRPINTKEENTND